MGNKIFFPPILSAFKDRHGIPKKNFLFIIKNPQYKIYMRLKF